MKKILLTLALAGLGATINANAQTVLSQNFESGVAPWVASVTGGGGGWVVVNTATNTQLGTIPAHTKYAVIDESASTGGSYNNPAKITSPTFSLVGVTTPYLAFDYYYFQAWLSAAPYIHEGAWVQMSTDGGANYSLVDSIPALASGAPWGTAFVSLASFSPTATCVLQFCYKDNSGHIIGVAIDNIYVYGASATDIGLTSVAPVAGSPADYFLAGASTSFSGVVTNYNATTDLASFTVSYQVGTSPVVTSTVSTPVTHLGTAAFTAPTPYTVGTGQMPVKMWVTTSGETNLHNDTMSTTIIGVPFMPKKRMVFEEATGTWCGWCVRGIVYMDSLWRADADNVSIISVHDGDPMSSLNTETSQYDMMTSSMVSGYPSMIIDRRYTDDPSGCFGDYANDNTMFGFANIGITTTTSGSDITAHIKVEPAVSLSGDYRLELVVTEDDVTSAGAGGGTGTWLQHNYYAPGGPGNSMPLSTIGYDFNTLPTDIAAIKFPFVARYTIPSDLKTTPNGVAGSLPAFMHFGKEYTYDFAAYTVPTGVDATKLRFVAMLIDNNPANSTYGFVLNSSNTSSHPAYSFITVSFVGVPEVNLIQNVEVFPNPATDQAHIRFELGQSATISCSIYDMVGRQVFNTPAELMNAGGQQLNISTADLSSGIYNVVIRTKDGATQTKRLSIVK